MNARNSIKIILAAVAIVAVAITYFVFRSPNTLEGSSRSMRVVAWIQSPEGHPDWAVKAGQRCGNAPFILPTSGFIGYLWGDTFDPASLHQGIDIFAGTNTGKTAVIAAFDGYLMRLPDWESSVIIRIPQDPLQPDRQIWTYYTHMADQNGNSLVAPEFPAGTAEVFVRAGTLLGYQGNYSGDPGSPVGVHLHFSVVKDDGKGGFKDERDIKNTLDPSPYFLLNLNADKNHGDIPVCP